MYSRYVHFKLSEAVGQLNESIEETQILIQEITIIVLGTTNAQVLHSYHIAFSLLDSVTFTCTLLTH